MTAVFITVRFICLALYIFDDILAMQSHDAGSLMLLYTG